VPSKDYENWWWSPKLILMKTKKKKTVNLRGFILLFKLPFDFTSNIMFRCPSVNRLKSYNKGVYDEIIKIKKPIWTANSVISFSIVVAFITGRAMSTDLYCQNKNSKRGYIKKSILNVFQFSNLLHIIFIDDNHQIFYICNCLILELWIYSCCRVGTI